MKPNVLMVAKAMLALVACVSLIGCDPDVAEQVDERATNVPAALHEGPALGGDDDYAFPTEPQAAITGWTPYTSEESPPITCDRDGMVTGVGCSGGYCDNIAMYCEATGKDPQESYWSTYVSEEGTNYRECPGRHWLVGIDCQGAYCDNLSLQCRYFANTNPSGCFWTDWVSEENGGTLWFGAGFYARAMECNGGYCDNKRFLVCRP